MKGSEKAKGKGFPKLLEQADSIVKQMTEIEQVLYQTKNRSGQDPLNFPIRLNDKLSGVASVASTGDFRPTAQAIAVRNELVKQIDEQLKKLETIVNKDVRALNEAILKSQVPAIFVD